MNCCIFAGRLTKDCEIRTTQSGKSVGSYTIAVDSGYGDNKRTLFLNCTHWSCEKLAQYLTKGKAVIVRGELRQREYQDKNGEQKRVIELNVLESTFQQGNRDNSGGSQPQSGGRQRQAPSQSQNTSYDPDDVPFS